MSVCTCSSARKWRERAKKKWVYTSRNQLLTRYQYSVQSSQHLFIAIMSSNDSIGPSFWSLKQGRADFMFNDENEDQAEEQRQHNKRQKFAMKKAYGIGYEWIMEANKWGRDGLSWKDCDRFFNGVASEEVDRVETDLAERKKRRQILRMPVAAAAKRPTTILPSNYLRRRRYSTDLLTFKELSPIQTYSFEIQVASPRPATCRVRMTFYFMREIWRIA